jgi:hypothetical protein
LGFTQNIALLVVIVAIFSGLLGHIPNVDYASATSNEEGDDGNGGGGGAPDPEPESEPEPDPDPDPGLVPEPEPPEDPCEENPDAEGCEPESPIDPCIEDPTAEGCEPPDPITPPPRVPEPPDDACLFDPSLPKCAPIDGKCPDGFLMNENEQCFPDKPCPTGFEKRDEDETGKCYPIGATPIPTPEPTPTPTPTPSPKPIPIVIIIDINTQIRNYYSTLTVTSTSTPTSCTTPQDKTISLGPGTMANNGLRLLAVFEPCRLVDGSAILNLPSGNNLKLLAIDLEGSGSNIVVHKAVVIETQGTQRVTNNQVLYNVGFTGTVTGQSPITENADTIQDINALFLWNDSPRQINFVDDNSIALNAVLSPS